MTPGLIVNDVPYRPYPGSGFSWSKLNLVKKSNSEAR